MTKEEEIKGKEKPKWRNQNMMSTAELGRRISHTLYWSEDKCLLGQWLLFAPFSVLYAECLEQMRFCLCAVASLSADTVWL